VKAAKFIKDSAGVDGALGNIVLRKDCSTYRGWQAGTSMGVFEGHACSFLNMQVCECVPCVRRQV
jgi:hypothetical protein